MRDGTPKGYAIINFKGNKYALDYKVAGKAENFRMRIFAPRVVRQRKKTNTNVFVNFFRGNKKDDVEMRVDNGDWEKMEYSEDYDPEYIGTLYKWDTAEKLLGGFRPNNPIESKHLWKAPIPSHLNIGKHTIEVKVVDMFGREYRQTAKYRISITD